MEMMAFLQFYLGCDSVLYHQVSVASLIYLKLPDPEQVRHHMSVTSTGFPQNCDQSTNCVQRSLTWRSSLSHNHANLYPKAKLSQCQNHQKGKQGYKNHFSHRPHQRQPKVGIWRTSLPMTLKPPGLRLLEQLPPFLPKGLHSKCFIYSFSSLLSHNLW